ncbi:MAG: DUF2062 domain-containing protein [Myxococcales bacterium]|jgi:uncharacterized protein (DUF2062 family)|nr:DUF2062 domain-containing protein [Myxococcales bacterium]
MSSFLRRQFARLRHFVVHKILGIDDSPHRIALGVAIGIFITWMPLIGFQMALTLFFATLLRANKVVGVPLVWISNPATLWIYIPNYVLGCWLLGEAPSVERLTGALGQAFGLGALGLKERGILLFQTLWDTFAPLMLGSVIIGAVLAAISYVATRRGVHAYRRYHHRAAPKAIQEESKEALPATASSLGGAEAQARAGSSSKT